MLKAFLATGVLLMVGVNIISNAQVRREALQTSKLFLSDNWRLQSSSKVEVKGDSISTGDYQTSNWYPAHVPSTVVGTLVENKVYPDPFFDQNLRLIPGCNYPVGANFANLPMPDDSPFKNSWWYRTEFHLPANHAGKNIWLHFDGINFRANIWVNGRRIAGDDEIAGTFRIHELNIKDAVKVGASNTLAVEVFPQDIDDLAWTFVDWNPMPPDKNMGIFRDVYLTTSGPVKIRFPQVITHFDSASLELARLTVNAELTNATDAAVEGDLNARFGNVRVSQRVTLDPHETKQVTFEPTAFKQLNISHPRVWWPIHLGAQNLYSLETDFAIQGVTSDHQNTRFGIREVTSEIDAHNQRVFKVNGRNVLIRGGGWASDMLLRFVPEKIRHEFKYVKDMNLNAIRLEGQLQPDYFFDLADQEGILILAGWCCCSHWEHWTHRSDYQKGPVWETKDYEIAEKSQADQIRRLRSHPSLLVWMNGSDNPPPADVEQMYINVIKKYSWPNPFVSSATAKPAAFSGASGVKMEGPYEWVPPSYWLLDEKLGGAHGFATEISPGPAVPPIESLRRMLPPEHLWPIDANWNYHAGGGQFKTLNVFTAALEARYGPAKGVEDYARKSQLMAYEGQRAMFEGYGANRYQATGVIQWMLNNAWPSMIWHLYDFYLMPGGGYFGTKTACEPVHVQYSYADRSVVLVNTTHESHRNLKTSIRLYDINLREKFSNVSTRDLGADTNVKLLELPGIQDLSSTFFLKLTLENERNEVLSNNFYWLSTKDDDLDWEKSTWYYTPVKSYADMTDLQKLPPVKLNVSARSLRKGADEEVTRITLANPSRSLAFFVNLKIQHGRSGPTVLPVIWKDNYISLLPGESREIEATYEVKKVAGQAAMLVVEGWNSPRLEIPLTKVQE